MSGNGNQKTCELCDSIDIVNESCAKCNKPYCLADASKIDPKFYCDECLRDVVIEEATFERTTTKHNDYTGTTKIYKASCKEIKFSGIDWMFASESICKMSDEELRFQLEYHKAIVTNLEGELRTRGVQRAHEQVQVQVNHPAARKIQPQKSNGNLKKQAKQLSLEEMQKIVDAAMAKGITDVSVLMQFVEKNKVR